MDKKYVFTGGFFNHAVGYLSIWNQASLSASDTMKYNVMFEGYYFNMVVAVQAYHEDNCMSSTDQLVNNFIEFNQKIQFIGSVAVHYN